MTEYEQRLELVALAKSLFERGYATGGAGNISVRLDQNRVLTTPTVPALADSTQRLYL